MLLPIGVSFQGAFMRASPISGVQEETSTRFINHVSPFGSCGQASVVFGCSSLGKQWPAMEDASMSSLHAYAPL